MPEEMMSEKEHEETKLRVEVEQLAKSTRQAQTAAYAERQGIIASVLSCLEEEARSFDLSVAAPTSTAISLKRIADALEQINLNTLPGTK